MKQILITTPYITLGQLLKFLSITSSGSASKDFLLNNQVFVNNQLERRRGRKLYPGDQVGYFNQVILIRLANNRAVTNE